MFPEQGCSYDEGHLQLTWIYHNRAFHALQCIRYVSIRVEVCIKWHTEKNIKIYTYIRRRKDSFNWKNHHCSLVLFFWHIDSAEEVLRPNPTFSLFLVLHNLLSETFAGNYELSIRTNPIYIEWRHSTGALV